jgi:DNA-binding MarR family transcriptional regulator
MPDRKELLQAVMEASRESSTTAIFFHSAIAEQVGIGATEEKTLLFLSGQGPLTAGEIAQRTGLTTASVTSLIDRLESKGFVRRVHDTKDRRRIIVEPIQARLDELYQMFNMVQEGFGELLENYSDDQLAAIADYLKRAAARSHEIVARLSQQAEAKKAKP